MTRILLAVDDSPAGLAAARTAIWMAQQAAGQIRAVHVLREPGAGRAQRGARAGDEDCRPEAVAPVLATSPGWPSAPVSAWTRGRSTGNLPGRSSSRRPPGTPM